MASAQHWKFDKQVYTEAEYPFPEMLGSQNVRASQISEY